MKGPTVKIVVHGTSQIGGTCIELSRGDGKMLLDVGEPLLEGSRPVDPNRVEPDAVIVSHAHRDHFGLLESPYFQWRGYLGRHNWSTYGAREMSSLAFDPRVNFVYAHTSGHAALEDLQAFAGALNPKMLIPVHTEHRDEFREHFDNVVELEDGEELLV